MLLNACLLVAMAAVVAGCFWLLDRRDRRGLDVLAVHQATVDRLTQAWREDIRELCQRLQAPQLAVVRHEQDNAGPDHPSVNPEDDEEYWVARRQQEAALEFMGDMGAKLGLGD